MMIIRLYSLFLFLSHFAFTQTPQKYIKANICLFHNDTLSAIKILQDTLQQNPNQQYALKMLGDLYNKQHQYQEAIDLYIKLFNLNDSSVLFSIVENYAQLKNKEQTIYWLKIYLKSNRKIPENILRTNTLFAFLDKDKEWNELWKHNWFSELEIKIGDIIYLYNKQDVNSLIETIEDAIKIYPNNIELHLWRAKAFILGQNHKEALKSINFILKLDPYNIEALNLKTKILQDDKKYKNLAQLYLFMYNIHPWEIQWKYKAALAYNKAMLFKESIKELEFYTKFDTSFADAYYYMGNYYFNLNNKHKAIEKYSKSIQIYAGNANCYYERAICYYDLNELNKAFHDLCMALDLNPTDGRYYYQRGLVNFALNKSIASCRDFERAKQLGYIKAADYIQRYCKEK
ncbi:MAG: tetratricopeptide repeat protein [Bacteroidales bacterium]